MFFNVLRTLNRTNNRTIRTSSCKYLAFIKEVKDQEEEALLKIEGSLFDNSSVKYEPIKMKDVLMKQKKLPNFQSLKNGIRRPQQSSSLKISHPQKKVESKLIEDENLDLKFFRLELNDPRLTSLLITVRSKKRLDKDRQIVIEGRRLILEALTCGLKLRSVIFSQREQLEDIKESISLAQKQFNTIIYKVPHHDLKIWSALTTPPGVMAIFERPSLHSKDDNTIIKSSFLPITVVCDNIREPNNLGSIIRLCAALPCMQVVITRGCCDPWESKALRVGSGGHFRLPIRDDIEWEQVPLMIPPEDADNCCIFVAENNLDTLQKRDIEEYSEVENIGSHNVVIIGGETHGVSQDAYRLMETVGQRGKCLHIPLAQGIDSLNVASALTLILYELRKKILKSMQEH